MTSAFARAFALPFLASQPATSTSPGRLAAPILTLLLLLTPWLSDRAAAADPPGILNHQGRIAVDGTNFDGAGQFKFALVNAAGDTSYWSNDDSSTTGDEPTTAVPVTVTKGHYVVLLGDSPMGAIPATVFAENADVRLRIWFSADGGTTFEQLAPDRRVASVGYALHAASADGVAPASVTAAMLQDNAVTTGKIADSSVTAVKLASGVVPAFNSSGQNFGIGDFALFKNTTGYLNTALGGSALSENTTGIANTALGVRSLTDNVGGTGNTAVGLASLFKNTTGSNNVAVGTEALKENLGGGEKVAIGVSALKNDTGSTNIGLGFEAGKNLTTGDDNIMIGNAGIAAEANTIRIGGSDQTRAFIAGDVTTGGAVIPGNNIGAETVGMIRWTGTDFEGFDGSAWVSLTPPTAAFAALETRIENLEAELNSSFQFQSTVTFLANQGVPAGIANGDTVTFALKIPFLKATSATPLGGPPPGFVTESHVGSWTFPPVEYVLTYSSGYSQVGQIDRIEITDGGNRDIGGDIIPWEDNIMFYDGNNDVYEIENFSGSVFTGQFSGGLASALDKIDVPGLFDLTFYWGDWANWGTYHYDYSTPQDNTVIIRSR